MLRFISTATPQWEDDSPFTNEEAEAQRPCLPGRRSRHRQSPGRWRFALLPFGSTLLPAAAPPRLATWCLAGEGWEGCARGLRQMEVVDTLCTERENIGLVQSREEGRALRFGSPMASGGCSRGACLGLYFRLILEFLFQDITWQDEHSAPFSWETRVSWIKFRFVCPCKKLLCYVFFSI